MSRHDYDLLVIGAGAAGLSVTAGAARLGVKTLLIEREPRLGGDCLHHGCVPSKTLIKSARVRALARRARDFGLPAPVGLDEPAPFGPVAARIRQVIERVQVHDSPERFQRLGAELLFGQARFLDEHSVVVETADGLRRVSAERIVLATGSSPALPSIPGLDAPACLTNRDIFSLDELPGTLAVLGAGPIAVEMAQAFARLGSHVVLIHRGEQLLSREDPDMAELVRQALETDGARVLLGCQVESIRPEAGGARLALRDPAGGAVELYANKVLVALGRQPNVHELDLDKAGVAWSAKGVPVDARMRTNQRRVFACGDVTGRWLFTHAAGHEAGVVVANAVFRLPRKADHARMPWCIYVDPELAAVGLNERAAKALGLDVRVRVERFADNDRALAEGESEGRLKLLLDRRDRPLGVQIFGPHAGELLNEWLAVLGGGVRLRTLAGVTHPYPTLGEINQRAAAQLLAERLFSSRVRKTLRLLFRYRGQGPR